MALDEKMDIAIIGGGIIGCAIADELARAYGNSKSIFLLEKNSGVGLETSSRNSGVVHSGFHCSPGTLKAKFCVEGNGMMEYLCRELSVPFRRIGKLTIAVEENELSTLHKLYEWGQHNGVEGLQLMNQSEFKKLEPNVEGVEALYSPRDGTVDPYVLTKRLAARAQARGVQFLCGAEVNGIEPNDHNFLIQTTHGSVHAERVINAAGLYADEIAKMVGYKEWKIFPNRGEYYVIASKKNGLINRHIYPVHINDYSKLGIHLIKSIDGTILIGPNAKDVAEKDDYRSDPTGPEEFYDEAKKYVRGIRIENLQKGHAGIMPRLTRDPISDPDFVITKDKAWGGFFHLIGIESPGLTCSPAIARYVGAYMVGNSF